MPTRKHRILFVDDDLLILRGLKRSLEDHEDDWLMDFVSSGAEALSRMAQAPFDAIVTDMLMPGMDGLKLLEETGRQFPGVLRYVLSGNTSDLQAMRSTQLVHQMFPKPCVVENLYQAVERSCRLRDGLSEPHLIRIITGIRTLPSTPALYNQLIKELQSDEPNVRLISDTISRDVAMTAKILQLVNSAFFGLVDRVSSPMKAINLLGLNTVKALVLSYQLFSEYRNRSVLPVSIDSIWKHSMMVSLLSRKIAIELKMSAQMQEDAQVLGILHDIGKLLEYNIPDFYLRVRVVNGVVPIESEYKLLGTSHAEMGAYLLGIWGLPAHIVETVMLHHNPSAHLSGDINNLSVLSVANGLINLCSDPRYKSSADTPSIDGSSNEGLSIGSYIDLAYTGKIGLSGEINNWIGLAHDIVKNGQF